MSRQHFRLRMTSIRSMGPMKAFLCIEEPLKLCTQLPRCFQYGISRTTHILSYRDAFKPYFKLFWETWLVWLLGSIIWGTWSLIVFQTRCRDQFLGKVKVLRHELGCDRGQILLNVAPPVLVAWNAEQHGRYTFLSVYTHECVAAMVQTKTMKQFQFVERMNVLWLVFILSFSGPETKNVWQLANVLGTKNTNIESLFDVVHRRWHILPNVHRSWPQTPFITFYEL